MSNFWPKDTIQPPEAEKCGVAPPGWHCTRPKGHTGPCAAEPDPAPFVAPCKAEGCLEPSEDGFFCKKHNKEAKESPHFIPMKEDWKAPLTQAPKEYRHPCGKRFDLLVPEFLEAMAHIMSVGQRKYGADNWKKGLSGENGGINHALAHLMEYMGDKPCDYGTKKMHLAQVAVNVMFEFHFERTRRLSTPKQPDPKDKPYLRPTCEHGIDLDFGCDRCGRVSK